MICISVTPESRKLAKVDLLNASRHCDLIELCLDRLIKEPDVGEMISEVNKPVLVSCRRARDGGQFKGTEDQRTAWLRKAIGAAPQYVELDLEIAASIPRYGETKRVISCTNLDKPLVQIGKLFDRACKADADVVKFTWPTPTLDAGWPLLEAVSKKRDRPVVGIGLGRAGLTFSLLGRKYGAPWIYAALEKGMEAHEGQPTVWELEDIYEWSHIGSNTKFVGIVGFGPTETKTVQIFNAAFKRLELDTCCLPLQLGNVDRLGKMLDVVNIKSLLFNPQAESEVLEFAEHTEAAVKETQYADLLLKQRDGWTAYSMIGRCTVKAIAKTLGKDPSDGDSLDRRNVLLIGAGGVTRSMILAVSRRKGIPIVTAPADDRAQEMAETFGIRCVPFANLYDTLADVVVITDPGVAVGHRKTQINPSYFKPNMMVADLCRLPDDTELLRQARERGARIVEPRDVLAEFISSQFKTLTRKSMPAEVILNNLPDD